ncbi:asparaginase [Haloplanus pelagicus]|jgi:L-asparaginase|uniref:asparaginase n=1 Tax=Haloplanus pelagicus TaxID=2949995 RepID=UPI00203D0762|nr:asparaginase [Haloplanus sp. HW8-1]
MRVTLLATGGTIASTGDDGDGATPELDAAAIERRVPEVDGVDDVAVETFATIPSPHMTVERLWALTERLRDLEPETDAVVVTHGTDTLEETAYFLDLCYDGPLPVAITGAMRTASDPTPDGPMNVEAGLRAVASDGAPAGRVVVAFAGSLYAARDASKTHTTAIDAFESREFGPLGTVDYSGVTWRRRETGVETYTPDPDALSNDVFGMTVTADLPPSHLEPGTESDAVCLASLGAGHVPPAVVPAVAEIRDAGVPVVVTSRCGAGRLASTTYDYSGSERFLAELGCHVTDLQLPKARIKTVVALAADRLDDAFERR